MPEDCFDFALELHAPKDGDDTSFSLDIGTVETDLRTLAKSFTKEASLDLLDARLVDDEAKSDPDYMPGDEVWL